MESFHHLPDEKQQRIINAALKVFAEYGYDKASTNKIVAEAGIGKGMLFYYFKNKAALFTYLIDFAIEKIKTGYLDEIDVSERDFFKRAIDLTVEKSRFFKAYPDLSTFLNKVILDTPDRMSADQQRQIADLTESTQKAVYENIDESLFRDDIDPKKAIQLIQWVLAGYEKSLTEQLKHQDLQRIDFDMLFDEFYDYMDVLKTSFYKKG